MTGVIIPALNAAQTLGKLLERIEPHTSLGGIVVVDDGSTDGTASIAREAGAKVLRHEVNRGKGAALRTAFAYVLASTNFNDVITLDADLQHDPREIPRFMECRSHTGADLIIGVRKRLGSGMPLHRILSNMLTSRLVSARSGVRIDDSQSGFRLISRSVLSALTVESDGFEAETEILLKAARKGFEIRGIPIATIYAGTASHMTHWNTTVGFLHTLLREY